LLAVESGNWLARRDCWIVIAPGSNVFDVFHHNWDGYMLIVRFAGRRRCDMTQQYVVGELSVLLAMLQAIAGSDESAGQIARLRREAEGRPPWDLTDIEMRALALADGLCWASLLRGNPLMFERQAAVGSQLLEFGLCAGLLRAPTQ
jgi:hypothetical protein